MAKIAAKAYLIDKVLFLNGLTRAGKFLLGKLVSCIEGVEYFQYVSALEHLPFLQKMGFVTEEAALSLIRVQVDEHAYNGIIGRNLNFRFTDASSIYNAPHFDRYLARSLESDIPALLEKFKAEGGLPCYIIHETLPNISIFYKAFPEVRIIDFHRHPVDIAHSWLKRGWGHRYAEDPLSFCPIIEAGQKSAPWYAESWQEEYENLSPIDRILRSVSFLMQEGEKSYQKLSETEQKKMIRISYESLVGNTEATVKQLATFLGSSVTEALPSVMAREKLPNKSLFQNRAHKLSEIEKLASKKYFEILCHLSDLYQKEILS